MDIYFTGDIFEYGSQKLCSLYTLMKLKSSLVASFAVFVAYLKFGHGLVIASHDFHVGCTQSSMPQHQRKHNIVIVVVAIAAAAAAADDDGDDDDDDDDNNDG